MIVSAWGQSQRLNAGDPAMNFAPEPFHLRNLQALRQKITRLSSNWIKLFQSAAKSMRLVARWRIFT
jgi:hypothetical protein